MVAIATAERTEERRKQVSIGDEAQIAISIAAALEKVRQALLEMKYGEVIVKVQGGKPVWVDRIDRERVG